MFLFSAAYMERQRMAVCIISSLPGTRLTISVEFHTDDEIGLGPLVAGLSLGSPALMHFRLLARHIPQGMQRSIAISFVLRHVSDSCTYVTLADRVISQGDILAMDGAGIQQFYE